MPEASPALPPHEADRRILEMAARQHGLVSTRQLRAIGVSRDVIRRRATRGWLTRIHRGVYRAGALPSPREREMAAILASGPEATLSHLSAAELWDLLPRRSGPVVHVTIRDGCRRPRRGVRVHRSNTLGVDDVTECEGLPVTTPARTLFDLATSVDARTLERAVARALRLDHVSADELEAVLARHPGRPGIRRLRVVAGLAGGPAFTRSEAERRFLQLVRSGGLPRPRTNVRVAGHEVDFLWRDAHLVVEVDGFGFHASREAFERDRRRDAVLVGAGYRVVRVTWRELTGRAATVLVQVAQALAVRPR